MPPVYRPPDDSIVPRVTSGVGWKVVAGDPETFEAPDGQRYVRASSRERADLIYESKLSPIRLRKYEGSAVQRKQRKAQRLIKRGSKHG